MEFDVASVPFILADGVIIVKDVPAEVCRSCREPFVAGNVTDRILELVGQARRAFSEVAVIS